MEDIRKCVSSIRAVCDRIPFEIIVSSNSCYPQPRQEELQRDFPDVKWQFNARNGGFAYGMNRGLERACGRYLAIVNPDVEIGEGPDAMLSFMDAHPKVGAIAPRIVDAQGRVQDSCRSYVSLQHFLFRNLKRIAGRSDNGLSGSFDYTKVQTVDWLIGAFILVRREAYETTGGLDDAYFMYAEDLDWCTRMRKCGFEIVYFPSMKITYKGSHAARRSGKYAAIFLKSHWRYWRRFGFLYGYPKREEIVFSRSDHE